MRTLLQSIVAVTALALAVAAVRADWPATAAETIAPESVAARANGAERRIPPPSTFAMGVVALAGIGYLHWRRRRFIAERAAF